MEYIVMAAVAALGLWATWLSGRDVGMRNTARMAEEQEDPTLMLKIETKGDPKDGVHTDEHPRPVCSADPVRAENEVGVSCPPQSWRKLRETQIAMSGGSPDE